MSGASTLTELASMWTLAPHKPFLGEIVLRYWLFLTVDTIPEVTSLVGLFWTVQRVELHHTLDHPNHFWYPVGRIQQQSVKNTSSSQETFCFFRPLFLFFVFSADGKLSGLDDSGFKFRRHICIQINM